jgi:alpha-L-fucosidase 2
MMYHKLRLSIFFCLILITGSAQQDLTLWYNKPASKWVEALPVGNGRIGAMLFGGVSTDRVQFNEETLWTGEPRNHNRSGASAYLGEIRKLLFEGKQKEAEALAEAHFMGLRTTAGDRSSWLKDMRALKGMKGDPSKPDFDDKNWKWMEVPAYEGWETVGLDGLDAAVWLRTTFEVPAAWKGKNLVLDLNRIRDHDFTYINGNLVGTMEGTDPRKYTIPAQMLKQGSNAIAIQVLNYFDKGGIAGYKDTSRHIGIYPEGGNVKEGISLVKKWKYFIQNDEPPPVPRYQADYQPFGDLWLDVKGHEAFSGYKRTLDLTDATSSIVYTVNGVQYTREYFISEPDQVMAIRLSASKPGSISFQASVSSPHKSSSTVRLDNNSLRLSLGVRHGALRGESILRAVASGGKTQVLNNKLVISNANSVVLYLSAATNYKNYKDITADPKALSKKAIDAINGKSFQQIRDAHVKEYQFYFNSFSIHLGDNARSEVPTDQRLEAFATVIDPAFAALYTQYGRYLLIASSRPGTRPANLQGIWNDLLTPPWGSKYTTNINAEMNYWPAELLNLSPLHEPLFKMIEELAEAGRETAKAYYNAPGWVLHHNTDLWRGTAPINAANHGIWVTGGAWLSHHLWERYLFTQDKDFLAKRAYPVLKSAAEFFNSFLITDPKTGWLISSPSNSPEQGGLVAGPSMDHQIIRSLFKAVIRAGEILNRDQVFRDTLEAKLKRMAPDQVGKHGQLQEWLQDVDDVNNKHRHVSHLWAVHPGNEINWEENPALMKAARQSLLYRGDAATGWSLGWKLNLWARFKDGEHAYKLLQMLLSPAEKNGAGSYPNLFDAHPPFQIDGNFGGAAGIGEMLVQSHTKYIDLLPALPAAFANGEVKGICARGGFVLNLKWTKGKLQEIDIFSKAGNDCVLRYEDKIINLKTEKGRSYKLNAAFARR